MRYITSFDIILCSRLHWTDAVQIFVSQYYFLNECIYISHQSTVSAETVRFTMEARFSSEKLSHKETFRGPPTAH